MTWKCTNTAKGDNKLYSDAKGVVPSLDLRFAEGKNLNDYMTGQNLITFSRSSTGTYVDENGIIQTATANTPRFDHDPTTGESLGLLIEEARTNYITYSEDVGQWAKVVSGGNPLPIVSSGFTSPAGDSTAWRFQGNRSTGSGFVRIVPPVAALPNPHTVFYSIWLKSNTESNQTVNLFLAGAGLNATVTPEWQRFYTGPRTATTTSEYIALEISSNTTQDCDVLVWGAQLEAGSFPTSYIPTTGTALTRNADVASITGSNFSSWYNQSEGTIFSNLSTPNTSCFGWNLSDSTNNNRFVFDPGVNTGTTAAVISGGGTTFGTAPTVIAGGGKLAFGYKANNYGVYGNQTQLAGTSPAAVPIGLNQIGLGYRGTYAPDAFLSGTIARFTYFPERLPDSTLQTITTP